jgi:glycosyltransferase involved in cell wall biosynthesis
MCDRLKLDGFVRFQGFVTDPASWFGEATLLVIPSRQEAFPNILLEGASAGLPIVATPCSPGVTELLRGKAGAWLTREVSSGALANSILAALDTIRHGERFRHSWLEPFDLQNSVTEYESLIHETLAGAAQ